MLCDLSRSWANIYDTFGSQLIWAQTRMGPDSFLGPWTYFQNFAKAKEKLQNPDFIIEVALTENCCSISANDIHKS